MSKLLESVDQRTQLVGENRLELLLFRLGGRQLFALNVFKIQEVVPVPKLTELPHHNPVVCGVTHLRGQTIAVIDLSAAIGRRPLSDRSQGKLIVTEYNLSVQAFLVTSVERIVNLNWELIMPPPSGTGRSHYLTAITRLEDDIVEILDVERVLADISPYDATVSESVLDMKLVEQARARGLKVLLVDDSSTAVGQATQTISSLGVDVISVGDGLKAITLLRRWAAEEPETLAALAAVVTDAEMPEMDGYRLTYEIRRNAALQHLFVILHTSLSGSFNRALVEKVGCDRFLSKFQPDELAEVVQERIGKLLVTRD